MKYITNIKFEHISTTHLHEGESQTVLLNLEENTRVILTGIDSQVFELLYSKKEITLIQEKLKERNAINQIDFSIQLLSIIKKLIKLNLIQKLKT